MFRLLDRRVRMPILLGLLATSVCFNLILVAWVLMADGSSGFEKLPREASSKHPEPAPLPTSATPGQWDNPASSCQATRGHGGVNVSRLQMFTSRLKDIIPSPDKFEPAYKSPCWRPYMHISAQTQTLLSKSVKHPLSDREALAMMNSVFQSKSSRSFVCAPQVYFMGFPRSGSTQLYKMLIQHPFIKGGLSKEPHWWTKAEYRIDFPHDILSIVRYISFFQSSFLDIEQNPGTLLMDGSQSTIWDTRKTGNLCFLPQLISDLFPAAKFIVLMRDPIQRLYSDFVFLCEMANKRKIVMDKPNDYQNSSMMFHERALAEIKTLEDCMKTASLEYCTHRRLSGSAASLCGHVRLGISLYHVHIKRWLREIPRSQFLFLRTEDMAENPYQLLRKVWSFLGVGEQNENDLGSLLHEHLHSSNTQKSSSTGMSRETEALLRKFFQPHNDALAVLLDDDSFRWSAQRSNFSRDSSTVEPSNNDG